MSVSQVPITPVPTQVRRFKVFDSPACSSIHSINEPNLSSYPILEVDEQSD